MTFETSPCLLPGIWFAAWPDVRPWWWRRANFKQLRGEIRRPEPGRSGFSLSPDRSPI